ncbi:MAG: DUF4838 domain-containing protein [Lentisphaerae bacterium]|nr:DUF4838 domain-containing protein [Lentisphaerota bacterium]
MACATAAAMLVGGGAAVAGELDASRWTFSGANAGALTLAVDNNLDTAWESDGPQVPGMAVLIDLGKSVHVCRIFLTSGRDVSKFPRSLQVSVGETAETLQRVGSSRSRALDDGAAPDDQDTTVEAYVCLRFAPVKGRFVKLEIGPNGAGLPWAIAEMDIQGATQDVDPAKRLAVVVDGRFITGKDGSPAPFSAIKVAAEDLQHYLTRMLNAPVDLVATEQAAGRTGLRLRLVTPPDEQVPAPEPDPKNLDDVSVVREGDEIRISGPTPRAVMFGAYEFLHSQGVRWLYPDPHGEVVPMCKELDLSVLPIAYRPPFSARGFMAGGMTGVPQDESSAYFMRHRLTMGWNWTGCPIGTIPRFNCGFGWAHTMGEIFDGQVKAHPEWWSGPYRRGGSTVPCLSNPAVLEFILQKMEDTLKDRLEKKQPLLQGFSVHPNDAPSFCECPNCEKLFGKPERLSPDGAEESTATWNYADRHFYLINALAERLKKTHPELFLKTLAYTNHERAPQTIGELPDNTLVDICPWWAPLPVDAPQNVFYRDNIKAWGPKCGSLGIWSYVLIYTDTTFSLPAGELNLVVPNVRALVSQNKFYKDVGIRLVSTQLMGPQNHWPWGLYAFARTTWRPDETAETILQDFFRGYYGDAWEPMLRWYETLERIAIANNIDTSVPDPRLIGADTIGELRGLLDEADRKARRWYEKERVAQARTDMEWTAVRGQWKTKTDRPYPCHAFNEAPTIDGKLDDAVWQTAPEFAGFRIAATRVNDEQPGRFALQNPTRFRMGWDTNYLYLGMACQDPAIEKTRAADAKDTKFEYRDVVEIFFAPEAPPYYRQTMVSSAGYSWGPVKIRQVNSHDVLTNANFAFNTAYTADGWTMEARFPLEMLASTPPGEGAIWPANLVRVANEGGGIGEKFTSWSDLPRFHFHQYNLGTWSLIQFREAALSAKAAAAMSQAMNAPFVQADKAEAQQRKRLAAFDAEVHGKQDLATQDKGATLIGFPGDSNNAGRRHFEIVWEQEAPTFDAVRIVWSDRRMVRRWYSLESWDGERYRLIEDRRDNDSEVSIHTFAPVKASRLRMTVWTDLEGWNQIGTVKKIDVFKR